ncbi:hypothetical protein PFISCL1PPCAC_7527, partial [Pristionchus fissidentatus]
MNEEKATFLESLPPETNCYLLKNGSFIFFKSGEKQLLYGWGKKCQSQVCELPPEQLLECVGSAGNALFFYSKSTAKYAFYRASFDEKSETIQFRKTYEKTLLEDETLWLALQQPLYQFRPTKKDGVFEVFHLAVDRRVARYSADITISEEISAFIVHKNILYLLVDTTEYTVRRITNGPRAIILVSLSEPEKAGCLAQDHLDYLYILTAYRQLVIIRSEQLFQINLQVDIFRWTDFTFARSITGLCKQHLLVNIFNPEKNNFDRWKVKLHEKFR